MKLIIFIILLAIVGIVIETTIEHLIQNKKSKPFSDYKETDYSYEEPPQYNDYEELPYERAYLLTKHEYSFYRRLEPIVDQYGFQILTKIRLADLIQVQKGHERSQFYSYFNKIKAKHIDFAIADHMNVLLLIELDDSSHGAYNRIQRDNFVNAVLSKCNYTLIRTYGKTDEIEGFLKGVATNTTDFNYN